MYKGRDVDDPWISFWFDKINDIEERINYLQYNRNKYHRVLLEKSELRFPAWIDFQRLPHFISNTFFLSQFVNIIDSHQNNSNVYQCSYRADCYVVPLIVLVWRINNNVVFLPKWVTKVEVNFVVLRIRFIISVEPTFNITISATECTPKICAVVAD